uniref:glutamine--tRNA ligase n=2 Tax=Chlamydomonas leiostraca TaxID=1034604 RepID=A0A7S0R5T3_9CHLO|mmetsp:Transcript_1433/g.3879  ORF Transcript_1433/g.3879 Transcript_1433/m.3879 type:complete len:288 (+) Transcript_1433:70-933(+)
MSKRKLNKLVMGHFVNGWDDPRLLTLAGLRRRGVTPAAINNFCREIGITRNENVIPMHKLEHHVRSDLDATSPRTLAVLRPLKLVITNLAEDHFQEVDAKVFPGRSEESYKVPFTRVVYIEATDFKEKDEKDFYGLAPGKSVMLRYAYPVSYKGHKTDAAGNVTEVAVEADLAPTGKPPKGVLNWVAQPKPGQEPLRFEARIYDYLFRSEDPNAVDDWLADINQASLEKLSGCVAVPLLAAAKPGDKFQFERLGYFCVDTDSKPGSLVFNRTVTLKESFPKQAAPKK